MPIVSVTPPLEELEPGDRITVESDAQDNLVAIAEIEDWCVQNQCVRVNEYHLNVRRNAGDDARRVGHCYRPY